MKPQLKKFKDSSASKSTKCIYKCDYFYAFEGEFTTSGGGTPFVTTPYVIRLYAVHPNEKHYFEKARAFVKSLNSPRVLLDDIYIHYYDEDFLILFKLKMNFEPQVY
jgi:hypothetical protein